MNFREWLQGALKRREMIPAEFARKVGVSTGRVSDWMTGRVVPSPKSCDRIADALGVDLDIVLFHAGHRPQLKSMSDDDPRSDIHGLVDRIKWTAGDVKLVTRILRTILEDQRQ